MNIHYQTFIDDDELIKSLDELLTKKNLNRSQLTEKALRKYLDIEDMNIAVEILFEQLKQAKWDYYVAVNTTDLNQCVKKDGFWKINKYHKDRCYNIKCANMFCISLKAGKLVNNHFINEAKKFKDEQTGKKWKKDFINEFNEKYKHGDFEPPYYVNNGKEKAITFWLENQTYALSKTSARQ